MAVTFAPRDFDQYGTHEPFPGTIIHVLLLLMSILSLIRVER
jgi:hypothetical protein